MPPHSSQGFGLPLLGEEASSLWAVELGHSLMPMPMYSQLPEASMTPLIALQELKVIPGENNAKRL